MGAQLTLTPKVKLKYKIIPGIALVGKQNIVWCEDKDIMERKPVTGFVERDYDTVPYPSTDILKVEFPDYNETKLMCIADLNAVKRMSAVKRAEFISSYSIGPINTRLRKLHCSIANNVLEVSDKGSDDSIALIDMSTSTLSYDDNIYTVYNICSCKPITVEEFRQKYCKSHISLNSCLYYGIIAYGRIKDVNICDLTKSVLKDLMISCTSDGFLLHALKDLNQYGEECFNIVNKEFKLNL